MALSNTITFYANPNFSGEIRKWNLNGQDWWNHDYRANSVDTHGTCVVYVVIRIWISKEILMILDQAQGGIMTSVKLVSVMQLALVVIVSCS